VEQVLAGLPFTSVIMDDVLVSGSNDAEHLKNVEAVLMRFRKFGLRVKTEKCAFMQNEVTYMGRIISSDGIRPTADKVAGIQNACEPRNVTELRAWLGLVNFHAQFIPHLSTRTHALNALLGKTPWKWSNACRKEFQDVKDAISEKALLTHYDPKRPVKIMTDASPYGVAAVLIQEKPVAYASRTLNEHERNYSQLDKEALGIIFALQKFHMYLYGKHFTILTDNKPVEHIMGPESSIPKLAAQRLQQWALVLAAYDYDLQYVSSKQNLLADALSRLPDPVTETEESSLYHVEEARLESLPINSKDIGTATVRDPILSQVLRMVLDGWPSTVDDIRLQSYFSRRYELSVERNCLIWGLRVVIPSKLQEQLLEELHIAHPGIVRMKEVARSFMWWPTIDKDIELLVRQCRTCQQVKQVPAVSPLTPFLWPGNPWQHVHVDYAEKDGFNFLVVIDSYSKWPEIFRMNSTTTTATIAVLRQLFSRYGLPLQLVSDNGPQFASRQFEEFLRCNGVKHVKVSPYHPASNGAAERMVQSFKHSWIASRNDKLSADQRITNFLLMYRSTPHATTGRTPARLFMQRELRTRFSLLRPNVDNFVLNKQSTEKAAHDKSSAPREFYTGESVHVKDLVKPNTWWPGVITQRTAPKSYIVTLTDGRCWKRHVDHVRSAHVYGADHLPTVESGKVHQLSRSQLRLVTLWWILGMIMRICSSMHRQVPRFQL
jgi:hypothetical protein